MIGVKIHINERTVRHLTARRISGDTNPDSINTYEMLGCDDIKHRYGDGAEELALKMLQSWCEQRLRKGLVG